jgi:hypothetical protein
MFVARGCAYSVVWFWVVVVMRLWLPFLFYYEFCCVILTSKP